MFDKFQIKYNLFSNIDINKKLPHYAIIKIYYIISMYQTLIKAKFKQ